jgi:hypothetical protein
MADEDTGFSLADLADIDVSNIEEVRFQSLPAGAYGFEVIDADLGEDEKDGARRFFAKFEMKIIEVKAVVDPNADKEGLVGKAHTERFFIKTSEGEEETKKAIGRIRAFIADIGMPNTGALGPIVRECKGHTFTGKIKKQKDKEDKSIEYSRLVLEPAKKAA